MKIKTYDESDLRDTSYRDDKTFKWEFIGDLPGDNPDVFGDKDNNEVARKFEVRGIVPKGAKQDPEHSCYYVYFKTRKQGLDFVVRLNEYIVEKAKLLREADAF